MKLCSSPQMTTYNPHTPASHPKVQWASATSSTPQADAKLLVGGSELDPTPLVLSLLVCVVSLLKLFPQGSHRHSRMISALCSDSFPVKPPFAFTVLGNKKLNHCLVPYVLTCRITEKKLEKAVFVLISTRNSDSFTHVSMHLVHRNSICQKVLGGQWALIA